jgi:AraC-like DNA-binding protein
MAGTHTRNVAGMVEHRRNLADAATRRAEAALDALERSGARISFALVAKRAGVSRSWLYKQAEMRERIARLKRDHPWPAHAHAERASDASKEAIIRTLRHRLADEEAARAKLVQEHKQLRKINEALAGEVYFCRKNHTANAAMASNYSRIVYHAPPTFEPQ